MIRAFYRKGMYSVLLVDGLSVAYMILDKQMYRSNIMLDTMWRHWMPASFAVSGLSRCFFANFCKCVGLEKK
jgi:hypothetical protein